ncbi:hypothetical protein BSM4216_2830 [Bacillus smithii]|nr:hypothetical protein BSM4216_2830 [Bacillus smithii]
MKPFSFVLWIEDNLSAWKRKCCQTHFFDIMAKKRKRKGSDDEPVKII